MYKLWFRIDFGQPEFSVDCPDIPTAQRVYDALIAAGFLPQCQRP